MSFPRYPAYKDSGVDWLGDIPAHWEVKPMKWVIARNDGGVWGNDPTGEDDTVVLRSTEQTVDGRWQLDDPALRSLSGTEKASSLLATGDLLVTKSSGSALHIGKTTLVTTEVAALGCCYSNFMQRIRLRSDFDSRLAWYLMNNEIARKQFDLLSNSTTGLANLNGTMLEELVVPIPSAEEQAEIVTFLDRETAKIDALVAEQEQLITLLKEMRQAVISHAVTKGLDPSVPMKDSGVEWLGEVPAHWALRPLKAVATFRSGGTPDKRNTEYWDGEVPWVSAKDLKVDRLADSIDHITQFALDDGAAALVPEQAIVVVVRGMILARLFPVAQLMKPMAINQDLKALVPKSEVVADYLAWLLRASEPETLNCLDEAGHGTKALRMENWQGMLVPVPPIEEQQAIAAEVDAATERHDQLVNEAVLSIELLRERRSALISAAVTGQIDVRGLAPAQAQAA